MDKSKARRIKRAERELSKIPDRTEEFAVRLKAVGSQVKEQPEQEPKTQLAGVRKAADAETRAWQLATRKTEAAERRLEEAKAV